MIYNNNQYQVAVYKFVDVIGCHTTGSAKHSHLPVPSTCDKPFVIQNLSKVRVGFQYLFGYNHEYKVQDGKIELSSEIPEVTGEYLSEHKHTARMVQDLLTTLGEEYDIDVVSGKESTHPCPFSGGSYVRIFKKGSSSAAVLQSTSEAEESDTDTPSSSPPPPLNVTPPKRGEHRCASSENKVEHVQSISDIHLQLQANMLLLTAVLLLKKLQEDPGKADSINFLVVMGCNWVSRIL